MPGYGILQVPGHNCEELLAIHACTKMALSRFNYCSYKVSIFHTVGHVKMLTIHKLRRHNAEVESVVETISNMTNPFDDLEDLVNIANGEIATETVSNDLLKSHEIGETSQRYRKQT